MCAGFCGVWPSLLGACGCFISSSEEDVVTGSIKVHAGDVFQRGSGLMFGLTETAVSGLKIAGNLCTAVHHRLVHSPWLLLLIKGVCNIAEKFCGHYLYQISSGLLSIFLQMATHEYTVKAVKQEQLEIRNTSMVRYIFTVGM